MNIKSVVSICLLIKTLNNSNFYKVIVKNKYDTVYMTYVIWFHTISESAHKKYYYRQALEENISQYFSVYKMLLMQQYDKCLGDGLVVVLCLLRVRSHIYIDPV